ncbi:juvenile hormone acid O-methyltransferase-like [Melitaea cinxia]|uniref:juvenile hormone acid O-methyltransferase-like n=1 Tax=Melitaea cinxia TaxID=113334 RepID=UPI001E26F2AA|nr:juvenile hormone acid O-methyltransferase-like [Melitaea cinxia]
MNNAELYHRNNTIQKRDVLQCLEEYGKRIKWKNGRITVIDIGCGDGTVTTSILKENIPNSIERLVGCDISKNMVQFANEQYANDHISFMVLDIEGDLPNELRGNFDYAFSFFALNWIQNQEVAFTNIYDLLSEGGECFFVIVSHQPMFDVYRILSRSTKWKLWIKDVERFISPYHDCQDPEKKVEQMMMAIGFTSVEVECLQKTYVYPNLDAFKGTVTSINPFEIPKDLEEDYLLDFYNVFRDIHAVDHASSDVDGPIKVTFNYSCDKSEKMIKYANEHYANDHTSFMVLDIEGDLPNELRGNFDHAFSFFVLHWIQHQEMAFTNIYDLLKIEGECFLVFVAHTLLFEGYRILSRSTRWKFWLIDVERFISPYHDCQDPEKKVKQMMKSIGFTSVEVECLQKAFIFPDLDALKGFVTSINPFQIPKDLEEDYLLDLFNVLRDLRIIDCASSNVDGPIKATLNHSLIVAKGRK